jgi:hypothetical protein
MYSGETEEGGGDDDDEEEGELKDVPPDMYSGRHCLKVIVETGLSLTSNPEPCKPHSLTNTYVLFLSPLLMFNVLFSQVLRAAHGGG